LARVTLGYEVEAALEQLDPVTSCEFHTTGMRKIGAPASSTSEAQRNRGPEPPGDERLRASIYSGTPTADRPRRAERDDRDPRAKGAPITALPSVLPATFQKPGSRREDP
jgi:hypothetical protein